MVGTISVPQQGTKGLPLGEVVVKSQTVTFAIKGAPGDPPILWCAVR